MEINTICHAGMRLASQVEGQLFFYLNVNLPMLSKDDILSILRSNKSHLEKEMGVRQIGLFGSYARNEQTGESDVDIYVELENNDYQKLVTILLFLEEKLGVKVDLVYKREKMRPSFLRTLEKETIYA